jgi:hypothetical protein
MPNRLHQPAIATLFAASLLSSPTAAAPLHVSSVSLPRPIVLAQHGGHGFTEHGGPGFYGGHRNGYGSWNGPYSNRPDSTMSSCGTSVGPYRWWHWSGDDREGCEKPPTHHDWGRPRQSWPIVQQLERLTSHHGPLGSHGDALLLAALGVGGAGVLALRNHQHHQKQRSTPTVRVTLHAGSGRVRLTRHAPGRAFS